MKQTEQRRECTLGDLYKADKLIRKYICINCNKHFKYLITFENHLKEQSVPEVDKSEEVGLEEILWNMSTGYYSYEGEGEFDSIAMNWELLKEDIKQLLSQQRQKDREEFLTLLKIFPKFIYDEAEREKMTQFIKLVVEYFEEHFK